MSLVRANAIKAAGDDEPLPPRPYTNYPVGAEAVTENDLRGIRRYPIDLLLDQTQELRRRSMEELVEVYNLKIAIHCAFVPG